MTSAARPGHDPVAEAIAAQRAAAAPDRSVWVAANAGAGKTKVLTDRIARLLLAGSDPSRILAVTYTKAAAAEMKTRLFETLGRWAIAEDHALAAALNQLGGLPDTTGRSADDLARARRLFARALDTPGGLKILTIHAFCQTVLQRFPLEAGVPPGFTVLDDAEAAVLVNDAMESLLADNHHAAEDFALLASALAEDALESLLRETLSRKQELAAILADGLDNALAQLAAALGPGATMTADDIMSAALAAMDPDSIKAATGVLLAGGDKDKEVATFLTDFSIAQGVPERFAAAWRALFTSKGPRKQAPSVGARRDLSVLHLFGPKDSPESGRGTAAFLEAKERLNAQAAFARTAALLRASARFAARYAALKAARGALDFEDLLARTRALLTRGEGAAAWVLFKLDQGIDHVLIDEAQDTSHDQWALLTPLFEELDSGAGARGDIVRTRFVVGDEKQSIYSFQGADPFRFIEERDRFLGAARNDRGAETLGLSWRTTATVLAAVDNVWTFGEAQAANTGGVSFAGPSSPHRAQRAEAAGCVELWPLHKPEETAGESQPWDAPLDQERETSPKLHLARAIAATVAGWLNPEAPAAVYDKDTRRPRPVRPDDVMVLVRRRDALFTNIIRALKAHHVPVAGADRLVLAEDLAVMDLIALGRVALLPEDDLTLATVLRGPFVGLLDDDNDLLPLCRPDGSQGRRGPLWQVLMASTEPRYGAAQDLLRALLGRVGALPPYEFYASVLERPFADGETGWSKLIARLGPEAREPVEAFLARALAHGRDTAPSLERFLWEIETRGGDIKREQDQTASGVRVMTIHGAKGLEAPIVFLPDTTNGPPNKSSGLFFDAEQTLWVWSPRKDNDTPWLATLREKAAHRAEAESRRLLYVGMTRARDRLILCGAWQGRSVEGFAKGSWYGLLSEALVNGEPCDTPLGPGVAWGDGPTIDPECPPLAETPGAKDEDLSWAGRAPPPDAAPPRRAAPSAFAIETAEPAAPSPLTTDASRLRRGTLIHELLQRLPDVPAEDRVTAAQARLAREPDLTEAARDALVGECLAVLDHPDFASLFGPGSRAEVSVAGRIGSFDVVGAIDRLLVTDHNVFIVDYKTNTPPPVHEDGVAPLYRRQMAAYRAVLAQIYPDRPIRCALLWTHEPRIMELSEGLLVDALQDIVSPPKSTPNTR